MKLFKLPEPAKTMGFAGFMWPHKIADLKFRQRAENGFSTTGYYQNEYPNPKGHSFYLDSDFAPKLRWMWCDEAYSAIKHTGWYCDTNQDQTIRGIVMRLPKSRGFIIGWSMGEGMISEVEYQIFEEMEDAAYQADEFARIIAERNRELEEESLHDQEW